MMTAGYGDGPDIINSCTITANKGEIVAILGPNGAGKSTAMKAMLGLLNLKSGSVTLNGEDISKINPQDRVKKGISFVPQTRNVFAELTVRENLEIGGFLTEGSLDNKIESIYNLFPILNEKNNQIVGEVTSGAWGYRVNKSIALAMVSSEFANSGQELEVDVFGKRVCAVVNDGPSLWDPKNERITA